MPATLNPGDWTAYQWLNLAILVVGFAALFGIQHLNWRETQIQIGELDDRIEHLQEPPKDEDEPEPDTADFEQRQYGDRTFLFRKPGVE